MGTNTEHTIISIPLSDEGIAFAMNYCEFYENAHYYINPETITIHHVVAFDPTTSIFWPTNGIEV